MTDTEIYRKKRMKLRKNLRGKQYKVARELGVSPSKISRVLSGDSIDLDLFNKIEQVSSVLILEREKMMKVFLKN